MLGLALALFVVVAETLLRVIRVPAVEIQRHGPARAAAPELFEYDPDLGWRGQAGARGQFVGWEFTTDVRLNSRGFRDAEFTAAKAPGVFRIVVLGDSIAWGYGVEQTQRFADLLPEAWLREGRAAQVVNLAVSGYGTDQELLLWERQGRRYCADLVLLALYENDVRENTQTFQGRSPKPYFRLSGDGTLALENVPVPRVPRLPPPPSGGVRAWLQTHVRTWAGLAAARQMLRGDAGVAAPPAPPPAAVELTAALVRRLAAAVVRDGAAFGVVVLPDLYYLATTMEAARRAEVVATLDLTPIFRRAAADGPPLFYRLDGAHWTPRAHALAADAIARWARDSLGPGAPRACAEAS